MKAKKMLEALQDASAINHFSIFTGNLFTEPGDEIKGLPIEKDADYMVLYSDYVSQAIIDYMGQPDTICDDLCDGITYYLWKIED